jgi:type I restriction enzyme S subunit
MRSLFNRDHWKSVRFGDVVDLVSETSRNPEAEGITRFIGLEHLEPGSLHIKTWGELVDGVTFTKRCRKGQVLFGKRRAYQRKVAIAEFDAVVSGDIYVFQAKEELLDPKLLPFLCMSERYFQFAVETSAGSLSPRTNWSHLKDFEFTLPPLAQQRRIAELLWAVDGVVQSYEQVATEAIQARRTTIDSIGAQGDNLVESLGDIAFVTKLAGYEFTNSMKYVDEGEIIALRALNIKDRRLILDDVQRITKAMSDGLPRSKIYRDDIMITYIGAYIGDILRITEDDRYHLAPNIAKITANRDKVLPELLEWLLRSGPVQQQMRSLTTATATPSLTMTQIRTLQISFPADKQKQLEHVRMIDRLDQAELRANAAMSAAALMQSQMINSLLISQS